MARHSEAHTTVPQYLASYVITFLQVSYVDTKQHDCVKF